MFELLTTKLHLLKVAVASNEYLQQVLDWDIVCATSIARSLIFIITTMDEFCLVSTPWIVAPPDRPEHIEPGPYMEYMEVLPELPSSWSGWASLNRLCLMMLYALLEPLCMSYLFAYLPSPPLFVARSG